MSQAASPPIPALPVEHNGQHITWRPWSETLVAVCGRKPKPIPCRSCDALGPHMLALGAAGQPPVVRVYGHYCPACHELRVYWRTDPPPGRWAGRLDLIVHSGPRAGEAP